MIHTTREKDGELWSTLLGRREDNSPRSENNLRPRPVQEHCVGLRVGNLVRMYNFVTRCSFLHSAS